MSLSTYTFFVISVLASYCAAPAWAKTATEVFEDVAQSIVVVKAKDAKGEALGLGSGVVIGKEEIVTNCHVIEKAAIYTVKYQERQYAAQLKHADWMRDVCSLTVNGLNAGVAPLGSTRQLKVGQKIFAIGAPQGLELTLSEGIISSLRELDGERYLQISTPISPGSSGGGLFDEDGRLIGLPAFYLSEGQQLNFAVPVEWVQALPQRAGESRPRGPIIVDWVSKTISLERKQDWPQLVKHAREWTRAQPSEIGAWFSLGNAYRWTDHTAKAIDAYQKALQIDRKHSKTWNNLGNAYRLSGQTDKAIEAHQQALRFDPEDAGIVWSNLGEDYVEAGLINKGIEAYQWAISISPQHAPAWYELGFAYRISGQHSKANELYQRLKRLDAERADQFFNIVLMP